MQFGDIYCHAVYLNFRAFKNSCVCKLYSKKGDFYILNNYYVNFFILFIFWNIYLFYSVIDLLMSLC